LEIAIKMVCVCGLVGFFSQMGPVGGVGETQGSLVSGCYV